MAKTIALYCTSVVLYALVHKMKTCYPTRTHKEEMQLCMTPQTCQRKDPVTTSTLKSAVTGYVSTTVCCRCTEEQTITWMMTNRPLMRAFLWCKWSRQPVTHISVSNLLKEQDACGQRLYEWKMMMVIVGEGSVDLSWGSSLLSVLQFCHTLSCGFLCEMQKR